MNAFMSLFLVFVLFMIALFGVGAAGMSGLFGIGIPYLAVLVFTIGFIARVVDWAKSPVPFRITTTAGQQKSLDFIKHDYVDNPVDTRGTVLRMFFEIVTFRSLLRNTSIGLQDGPDGEPVVTYSSAKWLWLAAILFHYSFLVIFFRHFRLFLEPVPGCITFVDTLDGLFQIGAPVLYLTDVFLVAGVTMLLMRRFLTAQVRYISLVADYFPLFLILGIAASGMYMRYIAKVDVVAIKDLTMGLVTLSPVIPANVDVSFFVHLFLVCSLLIYFPFSKLMHMGGVFMSPTRNLANNSRIKHHVNPWNPKVAPHSYEAYEDDFREPMIEAGLPVEKQG